MSIIDPKQSNKSIISLGMVGKCVQCGHPNPCFLHSALTFKLVNGGEVTFENLPHAVGAILAKLGLLERELNKLKGDV